MMMNFLVNNLDCMPGGRVTIIFHVAFVPQNTVYAYSVPGLN